MNAVEEIAKRAGVSTATVARTFRSPELIRKETADKILRIAGELSYAPRKWGSERTRTVANSSNRAIVFLFFANHPRELYTGGAFYSMVLSGAQAEAKRLGSEMVVELVPRYEVPTQLPSELSRRPLGGLLLVGSAPEEVLRFYSEANSTVVFVDHIDPFNNHDSVLSDGVRGAAMALQHLWDLGHRRIGFIAPDTEAVTFRERYLGYKVFCADKGIPSIDEWVSFLATVEDAQSVAVDMVKAPNGPTAIFAANDETASWVLHGFHANRISVPDDVSVVGFDDEAVTARIWPPLTTVHTDAEGIGRVAIERLIHMMKRSDQERQDISPTVTRVTERLMLRSTTAAPSKP